MNNKFIINEIRKANKLSIKIFNYLYKLNDKKLNKTVLWTPRWSTDPCVGGSNFFKYKETIWRLAENNQDIH